MIFDVDIERSSSRSKRPTDTEFGYLNLSARPEAERVRQCLEDWGSRYPEDHQRQLISRLRSRKDEAHISAVFELALHELALMSGHSVLAIEPRLSHTSRSPDFLLQGGDGTQFFLEAVSVMGRSALDAAADARRDIAIQAVDEIISPHHLLDLDVEGVPSTNVR